MLKPILLCCTVVLMLLSATGASPQDAAPAKPTCVAADEHVYKPGIDSVKPPEIQKDEDSKHTPGANGPFSIELLLNSEGRVCQVRLLTAKDREAAAKSATYIGEHWKFKPAIRQGKPVAVTVRMNFNIQ